MLQEIFMNLRVFFFYDVLPPPVNWFSATDEEGEEGERGDAAGFCDKDLTSEKLELTSLSLFLSLSYEVCFCPFFSQVNNFSPRGILPTHAPERVFPAPRRKEGRQLFITRPPPRPDCRRANKPAKMWEKDRFWPIENKQNLLFFPPPGKKSFLRAKSTKKTIAKTFRRKGQQRNSWSMPYLHSSFFESLIPAVTEFWRLLPLYEGNQNAHKRRRVVMETNFPRRKRWRRFRKFSINHDILRLFKKGTVKQFLFCRARGGAENKISILSLSIFWSGFPTGAGFLPPPLFM